MTKRKRTREKTRKAQSPEQLATQDETSIGRWFTGTYDKAWLLIEHPHSYREWNIVGRCDVPGFFYLESRFRLNPGEQPAIYTAFAVRFSSRTQQRLLAIRLESIVEESQAVCGTYASRLDDRLGLFSVEFLSAWRSKG
jgi:hypothetical protein